MSKENTHPFKICPNCKRIWPTMDSLLSDPAIEFAGYQIHFEDLKGGLFYFSHFTKECGTTLAIPVGKFTELSPRSFLSARGKQPSGCSNLCVRKNSTEPCPVECECLWVREIIQIINSWKKRTA